MKAPSQRQLRVGELIRHALSELFSRGEIRDPDLEGVSLTVSEVMVGPDLRRATAYVVPLGGARTAETLGALERSRKFIRGRIGRMVELKFVPEIKFELDTSFDYSERMKDILASPDVRRDIDREEEC